MDLSMPFSRRPIDGAGTIERTDEGVVIVHDKAGALPVIDDIREALELFYDVDRAIQDRDKAREQYDNLYGRHDRAMLLGLPMVPPRMLESARCNLERAESALADLQRTVEGGE